MNERNFLLFSTVFLIAFIILALIFRNWSRRLSDLRTLRLGRLALLFAICVFAAVNSAIALLFIFGGVGMGLGAFLLTIELSTINIFYSVFGFLLPIAILILTVRMWRRETRSFANLLLPIVMLAFMVIDGIYSFVEGLGDNLLWLRILSYAYPILSLYLTWQFLVFFVSSWRYGRRVKIKSVKYFVVLGAGLINGEKVGNLLANRIKAAVSASSEDTIFVMSGGKGDDENLSEAEAMKRYAVEEFSIASERILLEDQSRNTYENLSNTKKMLNNEKFVFFTSDFHVFRAALFSASLAIEADGGPGGKTALYYRVPAFIREFIAVLNSQRKKHITIISIIVLIFLIFALIIALFQWMVQR